MSYHFLPKFLIIRFAPGAGGNFLSSILQCSQSVAHWSESQELQKPYNNWLAYFTSVFPQKLDEWIYKEPISQLNWGTRKIFSQKYQRGNNLTVDEFLQQEVTYCNEYYHYQKQKKVWLPIFWHKNHMPEYFKNSKTVTIHLDQRSIRWYDHCVYYKHHHVFKQDQYGIHVKLLENRPEFVLQEFKNSVEYEKIYPTVKSFVTERITNNEFRNIFKNVNNIESWSIPNINITLTDVLVVDTFYKVYQSLCDQFDINDPLSLDTITLLHQYWRKLHAW